MAYELNPEAIGYNYLTSKRMLPKYRSVYEWIMDPDRFPYVLEKCIVVRNEQGIFVYPSVKFAKCFGIDKESFSRRFKKNLVDAQKVLECDGIHFRTKAVFFDTETIQAVEMFDGLKKQLAHNPKILKVAKIMLS